MNINKKLLALLIASTIALNNHYNIEAKNIDKTEETMYEDVKYVKALTKLNVREYPSEKYKKIGTLNENDRLEYVTDLTSGWYIVKYKDTFGYVRKEYAELINETKLKDEYLNMALVKDDIKINGIFIPKYEVVEIIDEDDDYYYTNYSDNIIGIEKYNLEKLYGTYIVVDISDQLVRLYKDNKIILESPCVSGKPATPTTIGDFYIFDISHNRYLIGEGYKSYVDVMMKFHEGEGFHDAEYHQDYGLDGNLVKSHGWRNYNEFGGETYLTNGSHGCVNMPHNEAIALSTLVDVGTRVLVKK